MEIKEYKGEAIEQGIYKMTNEEYHADKKWVSSTQLKWLLRSKEYFLYMKESCDKLVSLALERGNAFHIAMESLINYHDLRMFTEQVLTCSTNTIKTKDWNAVKAANPGCYVIPEAEKRMVEIMAIRSYDVMDKLSINFGETELSFFWIDTETGIKCKCRPDLFHTTSFLDGYMKPQSWNACIDYKTTKEYNKYGFSKAIYDKKYHLSAAMYLEGLSVVLSEDFERFIFVCPTSSPPYEVNPYQLDDKSRLKGHNLFRHCLNMLADGETEKKHFINRIGLPTWALRKEI